MSLILTIIAAVTLPFTSIFMLTKLNPEDYKQDQEVAEEVKGDEVVKYADKFVDAAIPTVPSTPIRKEGIPDLVIPNAHASLILDAESGTILHYNNGRERRQIASLTKLLTAMIVIEQVPNLDETMTIDEEIVFSEGTKVGCPRSGYCIGNRLYVGEEISIRSLLKAALMNSANDAAIALSKHVSGSQEEFAKLMNERVREMGLKDSNFCTPSGLEIDGKESECYSTAYDIARIAAKSLDYEIIWETMRLPNQTVIYSADGKYSHELLNTNIVLNDVPNCLGGKTGFTPLAGRSLLMAASDGARENKVIAVLLDNPYRWQDIKTMFSWAFGSFDWR